MALKLVQMLTNQILKNRLEVLAVQIQMQVEAVAKPLAPGHFFFDISNKFLLYGNLLSVFKNICH